MSTRFTAGHSAVGRRAAWAPGPQAPQLATGAVHVWRVDLDAVGGGVLERLSAGERDRAAGIAVERERALWSRSRGVLRELLARYAAGQADRVELSIGSNGKPECSRRGGGDLFFNLSHSRNLALYAFSGDAPVGVDIEVMRGERARAGVDRIRVGRRALGEHEARRLSQVAPERREWEFLRAWTRHEAELKRLGRGIGGTRAQRRPECGCSPAQADDHRAAPATVELDVGLQAAAALALARRPGELWRWAWA
ncbi:MAG TPA: 4'-phosphopantetheinyl transferase superfamily protein [Solirubrobacteraceae bacterium]|nr:4'-phosphopantetheinyl transferase superfamily protein [Solirubrobacteraceae bacterium]